MICQVIYLNIYLDFCLINKSFKLNVFLKNGKNVLEKYWKRKSNCIVYHIIQEINFPVQIKHSNETFVDETNIKTLEIILKKCPNIQSIDLTLTQIKGKNILLTIGQLCPKLQKIHFYDTLIDVNDEGVKEFAEMIGPQIIKCELEESIFEFSKLMLMHMKNVEEVGFYPDIKEQSQYLFSQLKSCEKLKKLNWIVTENQQIDSNHDFQDCQFSLSFCHVLMSIDSV